MSMAPLWALDQSRAGAEHAIVEAVRQLRVDIEEFDPTKMWVRMSMRMVEDDPVQIASGFAAALLLMARRETVFVPRRAAVITAEIADEIRTRYSAGGVTQRELGFDYGISKSAVSKIVRGVTWRR